MGLAKMAKYQPGGSKFDFLLWEFLFGCLVDKMHAFETGGIFFSFFDFCRTVPHWPVESSWVAPFQMVNPRSGGLIWFVYYSGGLEMLDDDSGFKPYYRKETCE